MKQTTLSLYSRELKFFFANITTIVNSLTKLQMVFYQ